MPIHESSCSPENCCLCQSALIIELCTNHYLATRMTQSDAIGVNARFGYVRVNGGAFEVGSSSYRHSNSKRNLKVSQLFLIRWLQEMEYKDERLK